MWWIDNFNFLKEKLPEFLIFENKKKTSLLASEDLFGQIKIVQNLFEQLSELKIKSGIYIIAYNNGSFYVGKSKKIDERYKQHEKKDKGIIYLMFKPFSEIYTTNEEEIIIKLLHNANFKLRNIDVTNNIYLEHFDKRIIKQDKYNEIIFSKIFNKEDQLLWLYDFTNESIQGDNTRSQIEFNDEFREIHEKQFQNIQKNDYWQNLLGFASTLLKKVIPKIKDTENNFWYCTCLSTSKTLINIYAGTRLVLSFKKEKDTFFLIFCGCITDELKNKYGGWKLDEIQNTYNSIKIQDIKYILNKKTKFTAKVDIQDCQNIIQDNYILRGIRSFVLDCMNKAQVPPNRHNYFLANSLIDKFQ